MQALKFSVFAGSEMSVAQWDAVSKLFSSEYGRYSRFAPEHAGERIRLGSGYYRRNYADDSYRVALCFDGEVLVGHVIYCELATTRGRVSLVVQLVVADSYRRKGIASTLLHSVWGFSDYYAWGIVSSNPFTVETLEAATFRRANASFTASQASWLREEVLGRVVFLRSARLTIDSRNSRAYTGFYVDHGNIADCNDVVSRLGALDEGEEWIAFVFREQPLDDFAAYRNMVDASSKFVFDAYSRMPQQGEPWAMEAGREVEAILAMLPEIQPTSRILDFGAGTGRHIAEFRKRGFRNVRGVDMIRRGDADEAVVQGDCRTWQDGQPADLLLCLYDVIGSFPDEEDNAAIVRNIARNLKEGGLAVVSVSNYGYLNLTKIGKVDFDDPAEAIAAVFSLRPSSTMATDGEFFNPNYLLVDEKRRLVCHKEQFASGEGGLPGEYLIRDRRYLKMEVEKLFEDNGLSVEKTMFVRAGFASELSESEGKEILLLSRRVVKEGGHWEVLEAGK